MISPGGSDGPSCTVTIPMLSTRIVLPGVNGSGDSTGPPMITGLKASISLSSFCQETSALSSFDPPVSRRYTMSSAITVNSAWLIAYTPSRRMARCRPRCPITGS